MQVVQHVPVGKPQHSVAAGLKVGRPCRVVFLLTVYGMRIPIDFDAQARLSAVEVGNEPVEQHVLPANVDPELVVSEGCP
jgi:hypothetical protein